MNSTPAAVPAEVPIVSKEEEEHDPEPQLLGQWALCLSGGGYRAMLFHLGAVWRLNEAGYLPKLDRVSSVSGGSILAGALALAWGDLGFNPAGVAQRFDEKVVRPVRGLAGKTIDVPGVLKGLFTPRTIAQEMVKSYRRHLYGEKTLQDFPPRPIFVINAANVQTGALWRFSRPFMGDFRVGRVPNPLIEVAMAVAASGAFPPFLSPVRLDLKPESFTLRDRTDLHDPALRTTVYLSDGGVYDNLGLETAWKSHQNVLVSDGGGKLDPDAKPKTDWPRHAKRVVDVVDNQVRSLRKRQLISSYRRKVRGGAYWGIRTDIKDYGLEDTLPAPFKRTTELAHLPTRAAEVASATQERLINWGYAVADTALRKHVDASVPKGSLPYPAVAI